MTLKSSELAHLMLNENIVFVPVDDLCGQLESGEDSDKLSKSDTCRT